MISGNSNGMGRAGLPGDLPNYNVVAPSYIQCESTFVRVGKGSRRNSNLETTAELPIGSKYHSPCLA